MPAVVHNCSYEAQIDCLELYESGRATSQVEIFPDLSIIQHHPNQQAEKMPPNRIN